MSFHNYIIQNENNKFNHELRVLFKVKFDHYKLNLTMHIVDIDISYYFLKRFC